MAHQDPPTHHSSDEAQLHLENTAFSEMNLSDYLASFQAYLAASGQSGNVPSPAELTAFVQCLNHAASVAVAASGADEQLQTCHEFLSNVKQPWRQEAAQLPVLPENLSDVFEPLTAIGYGLLTNEILRTLSADIQAEIDGDTFGPILYGNKNEFYTELFLSNRTAPEALAVAQSAANGAGDLVAVFDTLKNPSLVTENDCFMAQATQRPLGAMTQELQQELYEILNGQDVRSPYGHHKSGLLNRNYATLSTIGEVMEKCGFRRRLKNIEALYRDSGEIFPQGQRKEAAQDFRTQLEASRRKESSPQPSR